jgi:hypothetical protein
MVNSANSSPAGVGPQIYVGAGAAALLLLGVIPIAYRRRVRGRALGAASVGALPGVPSWEAATQDLGTVRRPRH